ncbi:MAG: sulfatase-like hydrolase/transferase [Gemmatimonadaceae bacterium]
MRRRDFLATSALLLSGCAKPLPRGRGPNIVLIMADDLGYGDLGITGRKDYVTPAIDAIGREGVVMTQAYSAAPVCTPTRVALSTGQYPARNPIGLYEPLTTQSIGLAADPPTLGLLLRNVGYDTALIGKWHLGLTPASHPLRHGYADFYGFLGAAVDYQSHLDTSTLSHHFYDGERRIQVEGYVTDLFTDRAVGYISRTHDAPFFLNLQYNAPHWPWQGPVDAVYPDSLRWVRGGSPEVYARMMESLDHGVRRVIDALRTSGIERETLVIFTSDNGGERFSHMGPFSESKLTLWEGGIRVVALARWPGVIPSGSSNDQVCITMDWTATISALAGATPDPRVPFDGIDLMPALTGAAAPQERDLYWRLHQRSQQKAMRSGNWKYLLTTSSEQLFNLADDLGEKRDRKADQPAVFDRLRAKYAEWEAQVLAPIPLDPAFR